jgi:hypothetical protein
VYLYLSSRTYDAAREQKKFCRKDQKEEDEEEADEVEAEAEKGEGKRNHRVRIPLLQLLKCFLPNNRMIPEFIELMYLKTRVPTHQRRPSPTRANFNLIVAHNIFSIYPISL